MLEIDQWMFEFINESPDTVNAQAHVAHVWHVLLYEQNHMADVWNESENTVVSQVRNGCKVGQMGNNMDPQNVSVVTKHILDSQQKLVQPVSTHEIC